MLEWNTDTVIRNAELLYNSISIIFIILYYFFFHPVSWNEWFGRKIMNALKYGIGNNLQFWLAFEFFCFTASKVWNSAHLSMEFVTSYYFILRLGVCDITLNNHPAVFCKHELAKYNEGWLFLYHPIFVVWGWVLFEQDCYKKLP